MILHSADRYIDEAIGQFSHFILLRHSPKLLLSPDNTAFLQLGDMLEEEEDSCGVSWLKR